MRRRSQLVVINFKICIIRNLDQKSKTHYRKKQSIPKERKTDQKKRRDVCVLHKFLCCFVWPSAGTDHLASCPSIALTAASDKKCILPGGVALARVCVCVYSKAHSLVLLVLILYILRYLD